MLRPHMNTCRSYGAISFIAGSCYNHAAPTALGRETQRWRKHELFANPGLLQQP